MKPLAPNFVYNGFGGSERADPFAKDPNDDDLFDIKHSTAAPVSTSSTVKTSSVNHRLKSGGLRNFKLTK